MAEAPMNDTPGYHETRLSFDARREVLWKTLCEACFQRLVPPAACVLELGAGYGHFINHIRCNRRIAVDKWPGFLRYVDSDVIAHVGEVTDLSFIADSSVDFVLASNLVEHLTQGEFAMVLEQLQKKLKPGGTLNLLQPNYRFAYREYFDDYTHVAVYSDRSLVDYRESHGLRVIDCRPRFLPLTVKSRLPVWPFLIRLYLWLPYKPLAKQMLVRAVFE
jgi:SAM-dependent methyltransferase